MTKKDKEKIIVAEDEKEKEKKTVVVTNMKCSGSVPVLYSEEDPYVSCR